ncbi:MAG: 3-deoxy-D-manno-octulosonic acid transferase [Acidobacteriota bacterium]|nr:3-deoxy-D-manno-octulosonic acid transferase [Acidobacteriota bacterium]
MAWYSVLVLVALLLGMPYWLLRMATSGRYRHGLDQRFGQIPLRLIAAVQGKRVVWVHAVSVGEVLAASRLIEELGAALGEGWLVVVSTTTITGQALARERLGAERVFFYPLDLAWSVRAYLSTLRPELLLLMESELWPRMVYECQQRGVPVVVANARVSDRSFARSMQIRPLWSIVLRRVTLFLAQSQQDAERLQQMGAAAVLVAGNLKYDVRAPRKSAIADWIAAQAAGRPILVAGSTVERSGVATADEDAMVLAAWQGVIRQLSNSHPADRSPAATPLLVLAPRHPERFDAVWKQLAGLAAVRATQLREDQPPPDPGRPVDVVLLDTIGDLAAVYRVATIAFVGGSLVPRGGHNPLEPAQFGVPILMGPSYENFRDVVERMRAAEGLRLVRDTASLQTTLLELLSDAPARLALGTSGHAIYTAQAGATARTILALQQQLDNAPTAGTPA